MLPFTTYSAVNGCWLPEIVRDGACSVHTVHFQAIERLFWIYSTNFIRFVKREMTSCEVQYPVYTDNTVSTVHGTEWLAEPSGCLQTDKINQYCYEYVFLLAWDLKGAQDQERTAEETLYG